MATKSAQIRSKLNHPVIDSDGHWVEIFPVFLEYVKAEVGQKGFEKYRATLGGRYQTWYAAAPDERQRQRLRRPPFWGLPTRTSDRAATMFPEYMRERMDDWGFDVSVVYPSLGFTLGRDVTDPDLRMGIFRAYNRMVAETFRSTADRLIGVGVVNLYDPKEAIEQLEHAHSVGLKAVMIGGSLPRPIAADADWQPEAGKRRVFVDGLGLDSPYDYDPVWRKFVELKMPVASHVGSMGWPDRSSPTNFVSNHLGHFAQSHHLFARSLILGGVTQRFPQLNFAFLEGGAGWACNLVSDLVGHWEKRNRKFMTENLKPDLVNRAELRKMFETYGKNYPKMPGNIDEILARYLEAVEFNVSPEELTARDLGADDFSKVRIDSEEHLRRLFTQTFYFGCEADDPMTAVAFDKRLKFNLKPVLGSDIGHFDVIDSNEVLEETWELVEDNLIDEGDFRALCFDNSVELFCRMNPAFFDGTVIQDQVRKQMTEMPKAA